MEEKSEFLCEENAVRLDTQILDKLEASISGEFSRSQLQKLIRVGRVFVNGKEVKKPGFTLKAGDRIEVDFSPLSSDCIEPYDFPLEILHSDSDIVVLNKGPGISVHPGAGNPNKTLVNALVAAAEFPEEMLTGERPGVVHRLDKDTSGVLVFAKNPTALRRLAAQFEKRSVEREYLALCLTTPRRTGSLEQEESGIIEGNVGRDPGNKLKMAVLVEGGKFARTHWRVRERCSHAVFVSCKLETGRTHQIRVHFESIGNPLVGDPLYGRDEVLPLELKRAAQAFGRQALHARSLAFEHPGSGEQMSFETELPEDFYELLEKFRHA